MPLDLTPDARSGIAGLRSRIDTVDAEISRLVAERRELSHLLLTDCRGALPAAGRDGDAGRRA